jgi:hypothetical protein
VVLLAAVWYCCVVLLAAVWYCWQRLQEAAQAIAAGGSLPVLGAGSWAVCTAPGTARCMQHVEVAGCMAAWLTYRPGQVAHHSQVQLHSLHQRVLGGTGWVGVTGGTCGPSGGWHSHAAATSAGGLQGLDEAHDLQQLLVCCALEHHAACSSASAAAAASGRCMICLSSVYPEAAGC